MRGSSARRPSLPPPGGRRLSRTSSTAQAARTAMTSTTTMTATNGNGSGSGGGSAGSSMTTMGLSLKDVQQCFEKERRAFLRDLECLRQQLVRKDQLAQRAAAAASQQAIQLKKELAGLQGALATAEADRAKYQEQFRHTSALLETALDQHQADQSRLTDLQEALRSAERKHDEALGVVRKEASASVTHTHEERKALRARVEQLRCKLETERKEWMQQRKPLQEDLERAHVRLQMLEKETQESRYREQASHQLKEKAQGECLQYKRKVADLSTALQEALRAKSEMKAEHQQGVRRMKDKWREILRAHQLAKEHLLMFQEDYNGLYRSRQGIVEQNERILQSMRQMKSRHDAALKEKEEEYWDLEKRYKRNSATCTVCMKTPEQRQEELELKMDAVREQTRLAVVKDMELERWDRYQDVNGKYMDVCRQLQQAMRENDLQQKELKSLNGKHEELVEKEKKLVDMLARTEKRVHELERKCADEAQRAEEGKRHVQELMENLSNLTTVTSDQSKQLQELEIARREEVEALRQTLKSVEVAKTKVEEELTGVRQEFGQQAEELEKLKEEKAKQWNEIVSAQLSANLLIEEQAHTIDNLLKTKMSNVYVSPSKSNSTSSPGRSQSEALARAQPQDRRPSSSTSLAAESAGVLVLKQECENLRAEIQTCTARFHEERDELQSEYEKKVVELMREVTSLQRERAKLKRRLEEQAVTIHELTLQEESDSEGEEDAFSGAEDIDDSDRGFTTPPRRPDERPRTESTWIPTHRHSGSVPRSVGRPSITFKNLSHELSAIAPDSDEDATVGISFLSTITP